MNDKTVVSRSCSWEEARTPPDACLRQHTPDYIETQFCRTCTEDGCNGEAMNIKSSEEHTSVSPRSGQGEPEVINIVRHIESHGKPLKINIQIDVD